MRHVVSMVANHVALSNVTVDKGDLFLFYTRVWSAVDRRIHGQQNDSIPSTRRRSPLSITHFDSEVAAFFDTHDTSAIPSTTVPVMCRQQECNSLAVATVQHLQHFPVRMKRWIASNIVLLCRRFELNVPNGILGIASRLWDVISLNSAFSDNKFNAIMNRIHDLDSIRNHIRSFVANEHEHLACFREKDGPRLGSAIKQKKKAHLLIPHLIRLSKESEQLLIDEKENLPSDYDDVAFEEDENEDEQAATQAHTWPKGTRPLPFSILPVAKLKRAMVYYGFTEIESMMTSIHCRAKKRKLDDCSTEDAVKALLSDNPHLCQESFMTWLFDLKKIKVKKHIGTSLNHGGWHLACFRTDGVKIVLTFCTGKDTAKGAQNVCCLCEAGYNIPPCECPIHAHNTARGLFKVHPERNDIQLSSIADLSLIHISEPTRPY